MADFELEQLKSLFESMSARLDETSGDLGNKKELEQIKAAIRNLADAIQKKRTTSGNKDSKEFIGAFFKEWDRQNPLSEVRDAVKGLRDSGGSNPLGGGGSGANAPAKGKGFLDKLDDRSNAGGDGAGKAGMALKGFAATVTAAAGGLKVGYDFLKEQGDVYRTLLSTAEGSVTSIMDMRNTAAQNNMSLQELVGTMKDEENLRVMGAKNFAKFSNTVRTATLRTGQLGMNFEQMTRAQDEYVGMLRSTGNLDKLNNNEMSQQFQDLIHVNQEMAGIMGKTRDEQLKAAAAENTDSNFNAAVRASGASPEQTLILDQVLTSLSDIDKKVFKEQYLTKGGFLSTESAQRYATGGKTTSDLGAIATRMGKGDIRADDAQTTAATMKNNAIAETKNRDMDSMFAIMGMKGLQFAEGRNTSGDLYRSYAGRDNKKDQTSSNSTNMQVVADTAILSLQDTERRISAGLDDMFNQVLGPAFDTFGGMMTTATNAAQDFADGLHTAARTMEEHPDASLAGGAAMGVGALALSAAGGLGGLLGLGKLFGRGGAGAGAGAGGAGGAARGLGAMARFALPAAGIVGGGLVAYDGASRAANSQETSTNAIGYGEAAIGGALTGAAIGSIVPVVGTAVGAAIGAALGGGGAMLYDWLDDSDSPSNKMKANAATSPKSNTPTGLQTNRTQSADATGQKNDLDVTMLRLNTSLVDVQTQALNQLVMLKTMSKEQLELMLADSSTTKTTMDRILRLLEEGNRNTRHIQGLA